jgi:hypothetical protein
MSRAPLPDPDADVADYLRQWLTHQDIAHRDNLEPAIKLAGAQLELYRPGIAIPGRHGLTAGLVAHVNGGIGSIPLVFATASKVVTSTILKQPPGFDWHAWIDYGAGRAREAIAMQAQDGTASPKNMMSALEQMINSSGGLPGGKLADTSDEFGLSLIRLALGALPDKDRWDILDMVARFVANDLCVALVGLFGKGSEQGFCCCWPIPVPLGRYIEAVIREHDDREL